LQLFAQIGVLYPDANAAGLMQTPGQESNPCQCRRADGVRASIDGCSSRDFNRTPEQEVSMLSRTCRFLLILSVPFVASVSLAAQQSFDKRFDVPAGGHLTLDADVGSVAIVGRDTHEVVIHADISDSDQFDITAEQTSSGVSVTGRVARTSWLDWLHFTALHVRFTIDVPRDYPVEVRTAGGSIDVRSLSAAVEGKTSGGGITLRDVVGSVKVNTSGGSIRAERLNGPTELQTSGGSIDVMDSRGDLDARTSGGSIDLKSIEGRVTAATSGGSIDAEVHQNRGVVLKTSGGTIRLLLPENVRASIDAETSGGRVNSELPVSNTELAEHSHLRGAINGGGEQILLRSSGGSIHVEALR
jgi:DUF4097 and DUF4098 domain-containing protein YvlB